MASFDENYNEHFYLGQINPEGPFPTKIHVHTLCKDDLSVLYVPQFLATIDISMIDINTIDSCKCSLCHQLVNIFDAYCCNCGAKFKSRKILGEKS